MARQLRLGLRRPPSFRLEDFVLGDSNCQAHAMVLGAGGWPGGALALVGPEGVGKSHLAHIWAEQAGAQRLGCDGSVLGEPGPALIEDVDQGCDEELLFHRINMAAHDGGGLLLTARTLPLTWTARLPDLRSRLNALPVAEITAPDDAVLEAVLRIFFARCNITPSDEVLSYLLRRIERSVPAAWEVVDRMDAASGEAHRPVTRALARQVLENDTENLDLFE